MNSSRLLETIDELGKIGSSPQGGITRLCLSPEEIAAKRYVIDLMKKAGLEIHVDRMANVIGILNTESRLGAVVSGSHVDTVINGGRYDGSYGVLSAIEAIRSIEESGMQLTRPLVAICFTNEEGVVFPFMTGSKYVTGQIDLKSAYSLRGQHGLTLGEALIASHLELEDVSLLTLTSPPIHAYIELHIEQGPILEKRNIHIGIPERIVGLLELAVALRGSADHAGTTPMGSRKDALVGASQIILAVKKLAEKFGNGAVGTVGFLEVFPNIPNVVPESVKFTIDFRHSSKQVLQSARIKIRDQVKRYSDKKNLHTEIELRAYLEPAKMNPRIANIIENVANDLGLSSLRMQSGAGHDAMIMSATTASGMIFIPSKNGKSHSPLEACEVEHIVNGANVLANTLERLART